MSEGERAGPLGDRPDVARSPNADAPTVPTDTDARRRLLRWRRAIARDPDVTGWKQETLLVLASWFTGGGTGYASQRQLATAMGCSERTARRRLRWAVETGWLVKTRRGHRLGSGAAVASEYAVLFPPLNRSPDCPVETDVNRSPDCPVDPSVADDEPQPDSPCTSTGQPVHLNRTPECPPYRKPQEEPSKRAAPLPALGGMNALRLGRDPDDSRYERAAQRCKREPDLGVTAQEQARAALGDEASIRAVVIRAAELLDEEAAT